MKGESDIDCPFRCKTPGRTRREFIFTSLGAFAATALYGAARVGEKPLVPFGIVTDAHYADHDSTRPPGEVRAFRESTLKLRECVEVMNARRPAFVIELGDFIESTGPLARDLQTLERIESEFARFKGPRYHVPGNHDFEAFTRADYLSRVVNTGIPADRSYYSFVSGSVTFLALDHGYDADGRPFGRGFAPWNRGHLSEEEFAWARETIASAPGPVVVFAHWRLDSKGKGGNAALDAARFRRTMEESGKVKAVFTGHDHYGYCGVEKGILYYSLKAMVTGSGPESSSYAEVALYPSGGCSVTGFRRAKSI
jgi:alkaline phosphatase